MSAVKIGAFFCEDFRVEITGQPIFMGVMSPVTIVSPETEIIDRLIFITIFEVDEAIESFEASISVKILLNEENPDETHSRKLDQSFSRVDFTELDGDWRAIAQLDLAGIPMENRLRIEVTLACFDFFETYKLSFRKKSPD